MHIIVGIQGCSQPNFPFNPGKAFSLNGIVAEESILLGGGGEGGGGGGGGGGASGGMPPQKISVIFRGFFMHSKLNFSFHIISKMNEFILVFLLMT